DNEIRDATVQKHIRVSAALHIPDEILHGHRLVLVVKLDVNVAENTAELRQRAGRGQGSRGQKSQNEKREMFHARREWFVGRQLSNETSQLVPKQAVVRHDAEFMFARHRLVPEIAAGTFEYQSARRNVP